jgi:peptidoglycan-associated lipoprotein
MEHGSLRKSALLLSLFTLAAFTVGCQKKVASTPPSVAPEAGAPPTVTLSASPATINPGQTVSLAWSSTNAADLDIEPGVGKVAPQGSTPVAPITSTTYTITATGTGGSVSATAHVDVTGSGSTNSSEGTQPSTPAGLADLFAQNVKDAYFDLDSSDLRDDARGALTKDAEFLRSYPQVKVSIEGHCDERGSTEYNLALGQRRAEAAKNYLISLGIPAGRMETTSWGKERPVCTEQTEECWQQNRRAHFVLSH